MNDQINTGGPAFPTEQFQDAIGARTILQGGMTLRDYFAAKAMQGYVSSYENGNSGNPLDIALDSYEIADTMIEAREKSF